MHFRLERLPQNFLRVEEGRRLGGRGRFSHLFQLPHRETFVERLRHVSLLFLLAGEGYQRPAVPLGQLAGRKQWPVSIAAA